MYGNTYTLDKMMTDLTNAIFQADAKSAVNTIRQNVQVEYVERLIKMIGEKSTHNNVVKGMVYAELKRISQLGATGVSPDALTKAHRAHIIQLIETALEDQFRPVLNLSKKRVLDFR